MNSNALTVISRALRRIGVLAPGELPQDTEQADALETLRAMYRRYITDGAFDAITDVADASGDVVGVPNTRYLLSQPYQANITPPDVAPDLSLLIVCDQAHNAMNELIYDGQTQVWVDYGSLELTDPAPFSHRDLTGLCAALAIELADDYGQSASLSSSIKLAAARFHMGLIRNYSAQPIDCPSSVYY